MTAHRAYSFIELIVKFLPLICYEAVALKQSLDVNIWQGEVALFF